MTDKRMADSRRSEKKVEILAPAGSYASFRAALAAGADAVYAGGPRFGARAYADNFTEEELILAIREAHLFDRKFYLTVNTLLKDQEIDTLYDYLAPLYESGLDAVIVQDVGVMQYVKTYFPDLDIHASTQMTVTGAYGAKFLEEQGIVRVVPARELSLREIRRIHDETKLEIECFVHGALCYCYSGQCLLSSVIGGRSGNRGQCAQPCRLPYSTDGEKKQYYLSPKDICTLELIPELVEAGIDSFKIEGRMKKPEYVAAVTSMYRKYTDLYLKEGRKGYRVSPQDRETLMDLYNRGGSSQGYYKTHNGREMMALDRPNHAGVPAVKVRFQKGREIHGTALTNLHPGDVIRVAGGKGDYTLGSGVAKGEKLSFLSQKGFRAEQGTVLNRVRNDRLIRSVREDYVEKEIQRPVSGTLTLTVSAPAYLTVSCQNCDGKEFTFTAQTETCVQQAQSRPLDEDRVRAQIQKTGNSAFYFQTLNLYADDHIFLPVQQLNVLRRSALEGLKRALEEAGERQIPKPEGGQEAAVYEENTDIGAPERKQEKWIPCFSVLIETEEQLKAVKECVTESEASIGRVYVDFFLAGQALGQDGIVCSLKEIAGSGCELYLAMPYVFREKETADETEVLEKFDHLPLQGALIRSMEEYYFLKRSGFDKKIILDHNLYVFNRYGKTFWKQFDVAAFTAPLELNAQELAKLGVSRAELMVYGRFPVMVSAQCLKKTTGKCTKETGFTVLTDRYGNQFPVKNICEECYNVIYNTHPLYLGMHSEEIRRLRPAMLRLQFSVETQAETKEMIRCLRGAFSDGAEESTPDLSYTQGHFKRGII